MSTVILLGTYVGLSDFAFDASCNGVSIAESEAQKRGLIDAGAIRRHARSNYTRDWYEVKPGDQIKVRWRDDDRDVETTFVIPAELPNPPQSPDHEATGMRLYQYLEQHCKRIE
jgi:hypothetical protein